MKMISRNNTLSQLTDKNKKSLLRTKQPFIIDCNWLCHSYEIYDKLLVQRNTVSIF